MRRVTNAFISGLIIYVYVGVGKKQRRQTDWSVERSNEASLRALYQETGFINNLWLWHYKVQVKVISIRV